MSPDFIGDLIQALYRVVPADVALMKDILIVSGMPESTENLRYLAFNRQSFREGNRTLEFSAVAVINNRRIAHWQLTGYREKISRIVFSARWTRNPMDLFINSLRCDSVLMALLASCGANYSLLGTLQVEETRGGGLRRHRRFRPVVAVPGIDDRQLEMVVAFENAHEIRKAGIAGSRSAAG